MRRIVSDFKPDAKDCTVSALTDAKGRRCTKKKGSGRDPRAFFPARMTGEGVGPEDRHLPFPSFAEVGTLLLGPAGLTRSDSARKPPQQKLMTKIRREVNAQFARAKETIREAHQRREPEKKTQREGQETETMVDGFILYHLIILSFTSVHLHRLAKG